MTLKGGRPIIDRAGQRFGRWLLNRGAIVLTAIVFLLANDLAEAHCYSVWHFPRPQRCGAVTAARHRPSRPVTTAPQDKPAIPLPFLARADLDGGEADEPTRARLLLRVALEAAYAH
jgi:hypothetical protein